jgi:tRNA (cmo5U34)-methyltransferase
MNSQDTIFSTAGSGVEAFKFDEKVANVFADMISRSVPGYSDVIKMNGLFAKRFFQPDSVAYDLGCSLGATTLSLLHHLSDCEGRKMIAVDNSIAMVDKCKLNIEKAKLSIPVDVLLDDIRQIDFLPCSIVAINYTLQFIDVSERYELLEKIYNAMLPGGALILSEKVKFEDLHMNELFIEQYHNWKMHNGYSELEIKEKRNALENVLIPDTKATHISRLERIGFKHIEQWFQCFNFVSFVAFK